MFNIQLRTGHVEGLLTAGALLLAREAVSERAAVIREDLLNAHRGGRLDPAQEVDTADFGLISVDRERDPTRGPIDGGLEITPLRFVGR